MRHCVSAALLDDFRKCIAELIDCNAFELQLHKDENGFTNCYIPYMMNDALECYFVLKDCRMTGEHVSGVLCNSAETGTSDAPGDSDAFGNFACDKNLFVELVEDGHGRALVIRQVNGDVSTLWFQDIVKELKCYRYHEIGHFWVKGQEHWRQLVYMIGTIYDKFSYMGEELCNDEEIALLPLMEFAPFRYWSPIHESLENHYPDTMEGFECFKALCVEAGDLPLLRLVEKYERVACGNFWITDFYRKLALPKLVQRIAHEMNRVGHEDLYELIYLKVCEASSRYPARDYGQAMNSLIDKTRWKITDALLEKGFTGKYPRFMRRIDDTDVIVSNRTTFMSVLVTEEHPFTLAALEYENYDFRIQMMVSEVPDNSAISIDDMNYHLNQGFFTETSDRFSSSSGSKKQRKGWIAKSIDEVMI